jgi:class 3 adenylate cyclase
MSAQQHTFLFADLAGCTALTEAHGDAFAASVMSVSRDVGRKGWC